MLPKTIVKRDGRVEAFDASKIGEAIRKCVIAVHGQERSEIIEGVYYQVIDKLEEYNEIDVEHVQDIVEYAFNELGHFASARAYILYREEHTKNRNEIPVDVISAFSEDEKYFPTDLQRFQFVDKYSRWNEEKGRRETWVETVDRAVDFLRELSGNKLEEEVYKRIRDKIRSMDVMPSMRLLAMAGEPARRDNTTIYNCAYEPVDSIRSFVEALLISMSGTGLGFSVESKYVRQLPIIKKQEPIGDMGVPIYYVEDSAEGWGDALELGLACWFDGKDVEFDYSKIRPEGSILKTKGGRASGPLPLKRLLDFAREKILSKQGGQLTTVDAHDIMCMIGGVAISGGVRRAAMLSLFDEDDMNMLTCKDGDFERENSQRWNANNSAVWTNIDNLTELDILNKMMPMIQNGRGEPGIFVRETAQRLAPERRNSNVEFGTNPCFAAGTFILTKKGSFPIETLLGYDVDIWNGSDWQTIDNFRVTAKNQKVLKITLHDGSSIRVTPYHTIILEDGSRVHAEDLKVGDRLKISKYPIVKEGSVEDGAYAKGFMLAEGTHTTGDVPILKIYDPKLGCAERVLNSISKLPIEEINTNAIPMISLVEDVPGRWGVSGLACRKRSLIDWVTTYREGLPDVAFAWDYQSKIDFIAGMFDGDGTASNTINGFMYQLSNTSKKLLLDIQRLLKTIGVYSKLSLMYPSGKKDFNDGYGEYNTKDCWRLTISQVSSVELSKKVHFSRLVSFKDMKVAYNVKPRFNKVVSIENDGVEEEVYCCTVEGSHSLALSDGILIAQCGEIILRPRQFCNMSAMVLREWDTEESILDKLEVATIIGTIQSMATYFPNLSEEWKKNCEEERLLGVDITGQQDNPELMKRIFEKHTYLKGYIRSVNDKYADLLGINRSAAISTVKPSGNTSQLVDCSSGLHTRWADYYIRRVRLSAASPVAKVLEASGMDLKYENGGNTSVLVASFPCKAPPGAKTRKDLNVIEQCNWWMWNRNAWVEHNPSVTIQYKADEVLTMLSWVNENKKYIGGMAFLPYFDAKYDQLPYEEITKEQYDEMVLAMPTRIKWELLYKYEKDDRTKAAQEIACSAGLCEL